MKNGGKVSNKQVSSKVKILLPLVLIVLGVIAYQVYTDHNKANINISTKTSVVSSSLENTNDTKVVADLKTIETELSAIVRSNPDFTNNAQCGVVSAPIRSIGIQGLNFPLSNYQVSNLATDNSDCAGVTYNVCAVFKTSTWVAKQDEGVTEPEGIFTKHGKGMWCFNVANEPDPYGTTPGVISFPPADISKYSNQ